MGKGVVEGIKGTKGDQRKGLSCGPSIIWRRSSKEKVG